METIIAIVIALVIVIILFKVAAGIVRTLGLVGVVILVIVYFYLSGAA